MDHNIYDLIRAWARDRNLIKGSDSRAQMLKLMEEVGELAEGLAKGDGVKVADSIGDVVVVLTILAEQEGYNFEACVREAYKEIKDRKGRMENGVFIKEGD